jgi:hypothetical protein
MIDNGSSPLERILGPRDYGPETFVGLVLDVVWADKNDRARIQLHAPHFGPNQRWDVWVSEPFS